MMEVAILQRLYDKFIMYWQQADRRKKVCLYIGAYTLVFLAAFLLAYSPILFGGRSFVNISDGRVQHFPVLVYVGRTLRRILFSLLKGTISIPLFDISMGLGDDVIGFVNSLGGTNPLYLLSAFVPSKYSNTLYAFLSIFRAYLAGLSFSYFCFYFGKRVLHALVGSVVYCFSGYAVLCSMLHPYFVNPMIILPLLIVGIDRVLNKKRPYLYILVVLYAAMCGFYHLYILTIIAFLYAVVRFFDLYKTNRSTEFLRALGRGISGYFLGIGLGAVFTLPPVMEFLASGRAGFTRFYLYPWTYYSLRLARLIAPPGGMDDMAFAAITLFAIVLLFFAKGRRLLKIFVAVALAFLFTSVGGFIMNGFQYPSNRWTFALVLVAAYTVVEMLPELLKPSRKQQMICIGVLALYTIANFATGFSRDLKFFSVGVIFLSLTLLALVFTLRETKTSVEQEEGNGSSSNACPIRGVICLLLIIFNVGVNGIYMFATGQGMFTRGFLPPRGYEIDALIGARERELEPFLSHKPLGRGDGTGFVENIAMVWQIPTMLAYSSVVNGNITEFWDKVENRGLYQKFHIYSTDQRTAVNTLLSGLYQVETDKTAGYVPFGYSKIKRTTKGNTVYKNDYALPWGYTYDRAIPYKVLEGLSGLEKQEAMLQGIALDKGSVPIEYWNSLQFDEERLPYSVHFTNCEWKGGILRIKQPNATISLHFAMPAAVEGYVRLHGFDINDSGAEHFAVQVNCGNIVKRSMVVSSLYTWYYGRENYLFNLGYNSKERNSLTLTFTRPGTYKLKDIELYALPMTNYPARVNALRAEPLKNIQWRTNQLSGSVDLSKDKILCVSVPYSKGWSATVDGQEVEILRGNYMFMALPLKAGHHDIVFSYCSPGLRLGAVLMVLSWAIFAGMLMRDKKKVGAE